MSSHMDATDVRAKKMDAEKYCTHATNYTTQHGSKPSKYGFFPHTSISRTNSFEFLVTQFVKS
jgi:hypothetical protein